jgi:hypothetical protein
LVSLCKIYEDLKKTEKEKVSDQKKMEKEARSPPGPCPSPQPTYLPESVSPPSILFLTDAWTPPVSPAFFFLALTTPSTVSSPQ